MLIPTKKINLYFSTRCAVNTPDESSPRGYDWVLAADYRLIIKPVDFFFLQFCDVIADEDNNSPTTYRLL
jgi:hypothetical protein